MLRYFWLGLDKQINGELAGDKSNRRVDLRALLTPSATETSLKVGREDDEPPSFACESLRVCHTRPITTGMERRSLGQSGLAQPVG
jgi:hypothetical protein